MHAARPVLEETTVSLTVSDIRAGLAANLATITNTQVTAYILANPMPPAIMVAPGETQYDQAFNRGHDLWTFTVQVLVGAAADQGAQATLDAYLAPSGSGSIKTAIESDQTLGGKVLNLQVTQCSGYRLYGDNPPVLGAEWTVQIRAAT